MFVQLLATSHNCRVTYTAKAVHTSLARLPLGVIVKVTNGQQYTRSHKVKAPQGWGKAGLGATNGQQCHMGVAMGHTHCQEWGQYGVGIKCHRVMYCRQRRPGHASPVAAHQLVRAVVCQSIHNVKVVKGGPAYPAVAGFTVRSPQSEATVIQQFVKGGEYRLGL